MDPFKYHDINELSPPNPEIGSLPWNFGDWSGGVAMAPQTISSGFQTCSSVSVPAVMQDTPREFRRTICSQPDPHAFTGIIQNRPQSKPWAIPKKRTLLSHNHHTSKGIGISSPSAAGASISKTLEWRTSAYNCSVGTMSPPYSPPNSLPDLPWSQASSPLSSLNENGSWRRRTCSQSSSSMTSEGSRPCSFCMKNGEMPIVYNAHQLHYMDNGTRKVACPILRRVRCPICGATGEVAHTMSHCPHSNNKVSVAVLLKNTARQCNGSLRKRFD